MHSGHEFAQHAPAQGSEAVPLPYATKFGSLLASAPDAIVIVNEQGRITIVNTQTERIFGYTQHELIGRPIEFLIPERFHIQHLQHRDGYYSTPRTRPMGAGLALFGRRKDGSEFPTEISLSPLETEQGILITAVIRDVTERKRAAEELERQVQRRTADLNALLQFSSEFLMERSLDAILQRASSHVMELVPDAQRSAIYLYDRQGDRLVLRASTGFSQLPQISLSAAEGLLGYVFTTRKVLVLNAADQYIPAVPASLAESQAALVETLALQGPPTGLLVVPLIAREDPIGILLLLRESGTGPFAPEALPILEALANQIASAIISEHNRREAASLTTELARLEEQRRKIAEQLSAAEAGMLQAARLAAVGQLAATIAHEINNPLYAARNCLFLIEEDLPAELRDSPYLTMAQEQLERIGGIIERMRDFYRPPRGEMALYDLNHLIEETLALAGLQLQGGAIKMIFAPAPDLPQIMTNGDQLRQVFLNLVLNAIEAMPNGGTLTVRTATQSTFAVVEVLDTGIGIPEDIRPRLFEPFFTSKPSGTGLGLSISAHIVTQQGGRIEVDSTTGQGSVFRVVLPYQ